MGTPFFGPVDSTPTTLSKNRRVIVLAILSQMRAEMNAGPIAGSGSSVRHEEIVSKLRTEQITMAELRLILIEE